MFSQHRAKQSEIIQYIAKQNKTITQHIKQKTIKQKNTSCQQERDRTIYC